MSSTELYITEIRLAEYPYIKQKGIHIQSTNQEKRNIIITGRNGCGKSTLLKQIKYYLSTISKKNGIIHNDYFRSQWLDAHQTFIKLSPKAAQYSHAQDDTLQKYSQLNDHGGLAGIIFNNSNIDNFNNVLAYFEAKRVTDLSKPENITAPIAKEMAIGNHNSGKEFIHHLVNRRSQLAFALEDNDTSEVEEIRSWFTTLDSLFSRLFEKPVQLKFQRTQLDFTLETEDGEIIDLKTLSDGYSAIVNMVTEIIMRMEAITFGGLGVSGIVLIDEVETHLHVALQREILPFLTTMFPNIQFIVTTHSPFVLQSVDDAIIYDLETNQTINQEKELWAYSYEALIDGYFEVAKFSGLLQKKIERYKELIIKDGLNREEKKDLRQLKKELENVPTFKNANIEAELKQLGLK